MIDVIEIVDPTGRRRDGDRGEIDDIDRHRLIQRDGVVGPCRQILIEAARALGAEQGPG